ncbi:helix-turn-helix transcriptional regulator [Methylocella sp.]|uniref:helix-turn-helix transcriptional regulator n=1 Tax=Methylocella sp. TaxID=1978226 RepID=UPI0037840AEE
MSRKHAALPHNLPPRLIVADAAAAYVGLSGSKFLALVKEGRAPAPRLTGGRRVWDVRELDTFVDDLPHDAEAAAPADTSWDDLLDGAA